MTDRQERLRAIFPGLNEITRRDEQQLRMECLKLGHEIEHRFFGNRLGRRLATLDHAQAFVDFVHNGSKVGEA